MVAQQWLPQPAIAVILAVMLGEYMILGLPRSVIPRMQSAAFGDAAITIAAVTESLKGVFAFLSNLVLPQLSDRIGRKTLLLITATLTACPPCLLSITDDMWFYQYATALSGLGAATWGVAFALIADIEADNNRRLRAYGLAMSMLSISLVIGPGIGAASCSGPAGCATLFQVLPVLLVGNACVIMTAIPNPPIAATSAEISEDSPGGRSLFGKAMTGIRETLSLFRRNLQLRRLTMITAAYFVPVYGIIATLLVYLHRQIGFSATDGATFLAIMGVTATVATTLFMPMAQWFGFDARALVRIGLCMLATALFIFGVGRNPIHFFYGAVVLGFAFITMPSVNALVAQTAAPSEQGAAQGCVSGVKALTEGLGPLLFAVAFSFGTLLLPSWPGLPYGLAAVVVCSSVQLVNGLESPANVVEQNGHFAKGSITEGCK